MTIPLIDVNGRLVSDFSKMSHKGIPPIVVRLGSR